MTTSESATPTTPASDVDATDVLFVDLDGTLIATDMFLESLLLSVKCGWPVLGRLPGWARHGRARVKQELSEYVESNVERLPYRQDVLDFLKSERGRGRRVVLATASDSAWARRVAQTLGVFDDVLASDGRVNLKGARKLEAIRDYCREHGFESFAYIGDCRADLPIWAEADGVYVVEPGRRLRRQLNKTRPPVHVFSTGTSRWPAALRALRPQQWIKNILLVAPLVLAHEWGNGDKILAGLLAVMAFSACSSSVYVINDLLDIEADRLHPEKRRRPFAAGDLPIPWGPPMAVALLAGAAVLAANLPAGFAAALFIYIVATTAYSAWLKRVVLVDVFMLAGLYTLRIVAGGLATDVMVSEWLIAFSLFLFTSLAFAKRYAEVTRLADSGDTRVEGRGYVTADLSLIESMGPTSGYVAVLVLALYINSQVVTQLYRNVWALWLICPVLLYWISRMWLLAKRRELSEDPVVFAVMDPVSLLLGAVSVGLLLTAVFVG